MKLSPAQVEFMRKRKDTTYSRTDWRLPRRDYASLFHSTGAALQRRGLVNWRGFNPRCKESFGGWYLTPAGRKALAANSQPQT